MAEALGIAASVITLATLAADVCSAFSKFRAVQELPGSLYALNNAVTDFQVVLRYISEVLAERKHLLDDGLAKLSGTLERAEIVLVGIMGSIGRVSKHCVQGKMFIIRAATWWKEKPRLQALQEDLHTIKASLNVILGASTSYAPHLYDFCDLHTAYDSHRRDMLRVQLKLQEVSLVTSTMLRNQISAMEDSHDRHQQIAFMVRDSHQHVEQRLQDVEYRLQQQLSYLHLGENANTGGLSVNDASRQYVSLVPRKMLGDGREGPLKSGVQFGGVRIRALSYDRVTCQAWCRCTCHTERSLASSGTGENILGRLFVGYTGLPVISKSCNYISCRRRETASVSIEYWFPPRFLHHVVRLNIAFQSTAGLQLQLRTLRRVPDSAECIRFALTGNIDGMRALFVKGLASPEDVSITRGYSIIRVRNNKSPHVQVTRY